MATAEALLTAEEYRLLADDGRPTELVRGRVVPLNMPAPRHGDICAALVLIVGATWPNAAWGGSPATTLGW
jgi:hypothetical protein